MAKIIGLGGVFIKFNSPDKMRSWYKNTLGITTNDYGVLFQFGGSDTKPGYLQLGTFDKDTKYFGSKDQHVMINFRVDDLETFANDLKSNKVKILSDIDTYDYGKFLHIEDPEGNRIELWEPIDEEFTSTEKNISTMR